MLTKKITYTDFDGNQVTEECQFHLTKSELMKMELGEVGGMYATLEKMVKESNTPKLVEYFDKFITSSYGKRSEDGKRFIKNAQLTEEFVQGLAYDELVVELLSNPDEAAAFFQGILPKELSAQIDPSEIEAAKEKANVAALEMIGKKSEEASNADNSNS